MLRKAWYAVVPSRDVAQNPVRIAVNGENFVVIRDDEGQPHAYHAHCPHRGCDLSLGTYTNNELICPFHGWRFNKAGHCTHIPANRAGTVIPPKAKLTVFPVTDRCGLLWIYTDALHANKSVPTLELFPELRHDDWRYVSFNVDWKAQFARVVESVLDVSHLPFVHPETVGGEVNPVVEGPDYAVSKGSIVIKPTPFAPSHPLQPIVPRAELAKQTVIELDFPNKWIIRTPIGEGHWLCTFLTFTPVDDQTTKIFGIIMRNFEMESALLDTLHLEHTHFVMNQDKDIIENLHPTAAPYLKQEAHVASDAPTLHFRHMLFQALAQESSVQ